MYMNSPPAQKRKSFHGLYEELTEIFWKAGRSTRKHSVHLKVDEILLVFDDSDFYAENAPRDMSSA